MLVKENNDEDVPVKYTSLLNKVSLVGILYSINFPSANQRCRALFLYAPMIIRKQVKNIIKISLKKSVLCYQLSKDNQPSYNAAKSKNK